MVIKPQQPAPVVQTADYSKFIADAKTKVLVSDRESLCDECELNQSLYAHKKGIGFGIHNRFTGRTTVVEFSRFQKDANGETEYYEFVPTIESVKENPALFGWVVRVFNG